MLSTQEGYYCGINGDADIIVFIPKRNRDICCVHATDIFDCSVDKHLQIFLSRNKSNLGLGFGQKYLVVNPDGFGLYELNSVDYNAGILQMLFTNPDTGCNAEINLDVNDAHPAYIFICWKDIRNMVYDEITSSCADEDLLELDNE